MVMGEMILVGPLKRQTDQEFAQAFQSMMLKLKQAEILPEKHVLDNEVPGVTKEIICKECHKKITLASLGRSRK